MTETEKALNGNKKYLSASQKKTLQKIDTKQEKAFKKINFISTPEKTRRNEWISILININKVIWNKKL